MAVQIRPTRKLLGAAGLAVVAGLVLVSPFLPLPDLWHQAMVGVVMVGFYLALLLGQWMAPQVELVRRKQRELNDGSRAKRE